MKPSRRTCGRRAGAPRGDRHRRGPDRFGQVESPRDRRRPPAPRRVRVRRPARSRSGPPPPSRRPPRQQFGANVNRLFNDRTYSASEIAAQLRALSATGATLARSDALWEATEPSAPVDGHHRFDWGFDDSIAASLAAQGLRWLPILDYTAPWDTSRAGTPTRRPARRPPSPRSPAPSRPATAPAARSGARIRGWPRTPSIPTRSGTSPTTACSGLPTPDPPPTPSCTCAAATRSPPPTRGARVIVGGLTKAPVFLPGACHAQPDLRGHIDGVAIHPYGNGATAVLGKIRAARGHPDLARAGHRAAVRDRARLDDASGRNAQLRPRAPAAGLHLHHTRRPRATRTAGSPRRSSTRGSHPSSTRPTSEDWFGIQPPSGGTSPDTAAFAAGLRGATSPGLTLHICALASSLSDAARGDAALLAAALERQRSPLCTRLAPAWLDLARACRSAAGRRS